MDQSAIKQIEELALASVASKALGNTYTPTALVPDGFKIQSLEGFQHSPRHHAERFKTQYMSEFFTYARMHDGGQLTIFIDEECMEANAIFDRSAPLSPRWQKHQAFLKPQHTPAAFAVLQANNNKLTQDDLIDFVTDWADHITFYDGETELEFGDALSRLRKLKVSKKSEVESNRGDFKASASALEQIEIDAAGAPLPSHFVFTTEPYMEFQPRAYYAQLRALGENDKAQLRYRLMGLPALELEIATEFKTKIAEALQSATIHIGTV